MNGSADVSDKSLCIVCESQSLLDSDWKVFCAKPMVCGWCLRNSPACLDAGFMKELEAEGSIDGVKQVVAWTQGEKVAFAATVTMYDKSEGAGEQWTVREGFDRRETVLHSVDLAWNFTDGTAVVKRVRVLEEGVLVAEYKNETLQEASIKSLPPQCHLHVYWEALDEVEDEGEED